MVAEVWLHIGTPKSGTSTLQKTLIAHRRVLAEQGLAYLTPDGRENANALAIAINKGRRDEMAEIAGHMNAGLDSRPEPLALISSEMLYGVAPETLFGLLPALRDRPVKVLVYLRRQDRYIEASYLQKSKNGRFSGTIQAYIAKFEGSGSDYAAMLAPWEAAKGAEPVPRVFEPDRLAGGDPVTDALAQIGLDAPVPVAEDEAVNVSPGLHRVQLVHALARAGLAHPRKLQRALAARYPQAPEDRAPILSPDERRGFLDRFADGNERLRARYHPGYDTLFDLADLEAEDPAGIAPFTDAQLQEIAHVLEIAAEQR